MSFIPDRDEDGNVVMRIAGLKTEANKRIRYVGSHNFTIAANSTAQADWQIPQLQYKGQNVPSIFKGVKYRAEGGSLKDTITFQIVDVDNILGYGAGTVLDEFGKDYHAFPGESHEVDEFKANLYPGLYLRVIYKNYHLVNSAEISLSVKRLIDTTGVP